MFDRILRAIRLDPTVYREIAEDEGAMSQAAIIVVVVSLLSAIGSSVGTGNFIVSMLVSWITSIVIGWIVWAALTYFVGSKLFQGRSSIPEMMRVLGFASAPAVGHFWRHPLPGLDCSPRRRHPGPCRRLFCRPRVDGV